MRKILAVAVLIVGAVTLTGCDTNARFDEHKAELNRIGSECVAAGGSFMVEEVYYFKYSCTMPGTVPLDD